MKISDYEIWDAHIRGYRATAPNGDSINNAGRGYNSRAECVAAVKEHIQAQRAAKRAAKRKPPIKWTRDWAGDYQGDTGHYIRRSAWNDCDWIATAPDGTEIVAAETLKHAKEACDDHNNPKETKQ